jgi:acetyl esterase/lipase/type 1 glutamine amidotransferase
MRKSVKRFWVGVLGLLLAQTLGVSGETPLSPTPQASPSGIDVERDVEYGRAGDHVLKLDVYQARERSPELLPAIVMIHGGGWRSWPDGKWTKSTDAETARAFAARGYWVASIEYRLSDVAPYPAALLDCRRAIRWVRSHARELKVDPDRIGVWGFSAGGHLALLVGCADGRAGGDPDQDRPPVSSRVQAVASWAGLTDLADPSGPRRLEGEREELARKFLGGTFQENPEAYRKASPLAYAGKDNPPTLLVHGDEDERVPYSHSEAMLERQRQAGVDVTLLTVKGGGHLFFSEKGQDPPLSGMIDRTVRFFDRTLKTPRVLVLTHSAGFVHEVVKRPSPEGLSLVEERLQESLKGQCRLVLSQDPRDVTAQKLKAYQAVVFYTSGELPIEKEALLEYVRGGGGFVCVHNGMATLMKYPPYGEMVGATFDGHPWDQEVTVQVEDGRHPSTAHLGTSFRIKDEIYQVKNWARQDVRVLLSVDPSSVDLAKGKRTDRDYALAWTKSYGEGRVFYSALGHYPELWKDERYLKHLVGGIRWVLGRD